MERKVLILGDESPRRRASLADAGVVPVAAPARGDVDSLESAVIGAIAEANGMVPGVRRSGSWQLGKPAAQGELDFKEAGREAAAAWQECFAAYKPLFIADAPGVGGWRLGMAPPCSGWWDYAVDGTDETGRMWFERDAALVNDGYWYQDRWNWASVPVCQHSAVAGTMRWRGLNRPWPEGYRYDVPAPGRRYRARLA